jgi:hypothetical protein
MNRRDRACGLTGMTRPGGDKTMTGGYRDKTAGLVVLGIIEIMGGLLCGLLAAVTMIPLVLSSDGAEVPQMIVGMMFYAFLAVWLIWMAIGTIRARRWARRLMLAASWLMLICGILAMGMMFFILPKAYSANEIPDAMAKAMMAGTYIFLAVIYLLFPAIGILFYGGRNVRATFEHRDPGPSWTEQCPLPLLVLVIMLAMAAVSLSMMTLMNFAMPFFGAIAVGWKGAVLVLTCCAVCIVLAFAVYQQRPSAWWGVLAMLSLGTASQLITFGRVDPIAFYEAMGYSGKMLEQMRSMNWVNGSTFIVMSAVYALPVFIYLLLIKRYFGIYNKGEDDGRRNNGG